MILVFSLGSQKGTGQALKGARGGKRKGAGQGLKGAGDIGQTARGCKRKGAGVERGQVRAGVETGRERKSKWV